MARCLRCLSRSSTLDPVLAPAQRRSPGGEPPTLRPDRNQDHSPPNQHRRGLAVQLHRLVARGRSGRLLSFSCGHLAKVGREGAAIRDGAPDRSAQIIDEDVPGRFSTGPSNVLLQPTNLVAEAAAETDFHPPTLMRVEFTGLPELILADPKKAGELPIGGICKSQSVANSLTAKTARWAARSFAAKLVGEFAAGDLRSR